MVVLDGVVVDGITVDGITVDGITVGADAKVAMAVDVIAVNGK